MANRGDSAIEDPNIAWVSVLDDLAFDDSPIAQGDGSHQEPTPASALRLWGKGTDRSWSVMAAVAAIVAGDPQCVLDEDIGEIQACLVQAFEEAPAGNRRQIQLARCAVAIRLKNYALALDLLDTLAQENESRSERRRRLEQRVEILQGLGEHDEASRLRRHLQMDDLLDAEVPSLNLRSEALALLKARHYAEAERIYLHLVKRGYDLDSTHCHLVRICLLQDRSDDAFRHLEIAEQHCRTHSYVRARIIFFRVVHCYLSRRSAGTLLSQLRQTLAEPGAFEDWIMEPVVERLNKQLPAAQIEILATLTKVLSSVTNLSLLDTIISLDAPRSQ